MKLKIIFSFLIFAFITASVHAEKIPVRIKNAQLISTKTDEIQVGDYVKFEILNDVNIGDKLYLKANTPIYGLVDFMHPNGWSGDNAEIRFKTFYTKDIDNKKIVINYPVTINGNKEQANDFKQLLAYEVLFIFRGSEIYIEPNRQSYNLFIER